jgi:hypothetical protein
MLLLKVSPGTGDTSKDMVRDIVEQAQGAGGHTTLSKSDKQVLVDALNTHRSESSTGIVRRPMAQVHDTRAVMDRVQREVCSYIPGPLFTLLSSP